MSDPAASAFDAFKPLAGRALETALNRLVALDADTAAALVQLEGRRIGLALQSPALALEVSVAAGRLQVGPASAEPDLGLRGTLSGVLAQLPFLRPPDASSVGQLRIHGDAELARTLQKLASNYDPDWQRPFAEAFGPLLGPQIARALREAFRAGRNVAGSWARDGVEFLTEESRDLLGKAELAAFHDDVDSVRDAAERLAARIARLQAGP